MEEKANTEQATGKKSPFYSPHLWIIIALFVLITLNHYGGQIGIHWAILPDSLFGLTRHTVDRVLYLVPIIYSTFVFKLMGGVGSLAAAFILMLPRAIFISPSPPDALLETAAIMAIGVILLLWLNSRRKQSEQLEITLARLETAQRKLQSQVRATIERERELSTITAFCAMCAQCSEIQQVLKAAIDMVMEMMKVEVALIWSLDKQTQELRIIAFEGVPKEFALGVDRIRLGEGFNGRVAQTGEPMLVEDASSDPRLTRHVVQQENLQSQLIVPLVAQDKVIGTLCVATRQPHQFTHDEIELLAATGNQIGIVIENSYLCQERLAVTEQLKQSEEKYRQLFESAHDAIWVHNLEGNITTANYAMAELVGCDLQELIGQDVRGTLSKDGLLLAKEVKKKLLQGERIEAYEQKLTRKDGNEAILMLTTNLITSDGQPSAFQHIARDITKERQMQENLRFYVQQITKVQEEERQRIAREFHDSTIQRLIATLHQLESFLQDKKRLPMSDSRFLWNIQEQIKDAIQEVRYFSRDLRPSILDDLGLLPAIEWLTEELKKERKIETGLTVLGEEQRFSPEANLILFRIVQEALRNVARHAQATKSQVTIKFEDKETEIAIQDNGKGFEPPESLSELPRLGKLGLAGMQERARLIGGKLNILSELGKGTIITIAIPKETS